MALDKPLNTAGASEEYSNPRRAPRFALACRLRIVLPKHKGLRPFSGQGNDISEFGMAMFVATDLEVGEVVQVEFLLPYSHQKLLVQATVRNRKGFRYGMEFLNPTMPERQAIASACRALTLLQ